MRRKEILKGQLTVPAQIIELIKDTAQVECTNMFKALWNNYLKNKSGVALPYWSDRIANPVEFNKFIKHLSNAGWIITKVEPQRNWGEAKLNEDKLLKWVSREELTTLRADLKFNQYRLRNSESTISMITKTTSGLKHTGIVREGFAKAGNNTFTYDLKYLAKYRQHIEMNVTKSIRMLELDTSAFNDDTDYEAVSRSLIEYYLFSDDEYSLGNSISDSRGRAISSSLSKVFNPLGFKDARALLVTEPKALGVAGHKAIYLFIAELLGIKVASISDKAHAGAEAHATRQLHDLDLSTDEGRAELHENIWLERIYDNLDTYHIDRKWTVPVEVDFTASMLQIEGLLLEHTPFLDRTNVIGDELKDIWTVPGIPRKQFKKAMTPILYGSSKTAAQLWKQSKIEYTTAQARIFNQEISSGDFAVANSFKEFIIKNVKPEPTMKVKIWNEEFEINCTRFRNVGDYTKKYDIYDTKSGTVKSIFHTHTHQEPDLQQFKRYFVTLLVHNLDSQVADYICDQMTEWVLPNHDAFICHPADTKEVKTLAASKYKAIHKDRKSIIKNYFGSIGIDSKSAVEWSMLQEKIITNMPIKIKDTLLK